VGLFVWILICVGCWFVAVRSFWRFDVFSISTHSERTVIGTADDLDVSSVTVSSLAGSFVLNDQSPQWNDSGQSSTGLLDYRSGHYRSYDARHGKAYDSLQHSTLTNELTWLLPDFESNRLDYGNSGYVSLFHLHLPWWLILAIIHSPLPFILRAKRRRFRREDNLCLKCGYDLRSSSGRCSECGRVI